MGKFEGNFLQSPRSNEKKEKDVYVKETVYGDGRVREYFDRSFDLREFNTAQMWLFSPNASVVKDIEYITRTGKRFRFSTLLQKGCRLVHDIKLEFTAARVANVVVYGDRPKTFLPSGEEEAKERFDFFKMPGAFLILLHEIGHLQSSQFGVGLPKSNREAANKKDARGIKRGGAVYGLSLEDIQEERDAWAYALRKMRELRSNGVDLEPALDTKEKLFDVIHKALVSYELTAVKDSSRHIDLILKPLREKIEKGVIPVADDLTKSLVKNAVRPIRLGVKKHK